MARTLRLWVHLETGDIASILVDPDNPHIWVLFEPGPNGEPGFTIKNDQTEIGNKSVYKVSTARPKPSWWPF
jgi:hypothetical protein